MAPVQGAAHCSGEDSSRSHCVCPQEADRQMLALNSFFSSFKCRQSHLKCSCLNSRNKSSVFLRSCPGICLPGDPRFSQVDNLTHYPLQCVHMEEQKLKMSQVGKHSRNKDIDSRTNGTNTWKITREAKRQ